MQLPKELRMGAELGIADRFMVAQLRKLPPQRPEVLLGGYQDPRRTRRQTGQDEQPARIETEVRAAGPHHGTLIDHIGRSN